MKGKLLLIGVALAMVLSLCGCRDIATGAKPVIYLYPEEETQVEVKLDYDGVLTHTWPKSGGHWSVTACPDGTLTGEDGEAYSYLFWEGDTDAIEYDFSKGFCVPGGETGEFLRDVLTEIGLTPKEYNEFIVYWMPLMEGNAYNLISFQGANYTDHARLTVTPELDSVLRVFMVWKAVDEPVEIEPQTFEPFERRGFTLVEWGGSDLN